MDKPLTRQEWRLAAASAVATSRGTTAEKDHTAQTADVALTPAALKSRKSAASEQFFAGLWAVQPFIVAA
jgi:hypothetical protein